MLFYMTLESQHSLKISIDWIHILVRLIAGTLRDKDYCMKVERALLWLSQDISGLWLWKVNYSHSMSQVIYVQEIQAVVHRTKTGGTRIQQRILSLVDEEAAGHGCQHLTSRLGIR